MTIPNKVAPMRSGIAGTLAKEGPLRAFAATLDYTLSGENFATPSRAVCFVDANAGTVEPGGSSGGIFAGLILGNERVLSDVGESWYSDGDCIEVVQMGEVFVNIDDVAGQTGYQTAAVGSPINYEKATGKLTVGTPDSDFIKVPGAVITAISPYDATEGARLARVTLNGPTA